MKFITAFSGIQLRSWAAWHSTTKSHQHVSFLSIYLLSIYLLYIWYQSIFYLSIFYLSIRHTISETFREKFEGPCRNCWKTWDEYYWQYHVYAATCSGSFLAPKILNARDICPFATFITIDDAAPWPIAQYWVGLECCCYWEGQLCDLPI